MKKASSFLYIAAMSVIIAALFHLPFLAVCGVLTFASTVVHTDKDMALMAVTREIWESDLVGNLFKNNEFAKRAFNADAYVLAGKVVHIPVAGAPSAINKNITNFPVAAVKRTDADVTYQIDTYYSVPRHVESIEQYELAYDKRQSVLGEDQSAIIEAAMNGLLYRWAGANTILTTGAATAATISGATGNRKLFTKTVFGTVKLAFDRISIPGAGRVALLTADHHQQLLDSFSDVEKTNFNNLADFKNGIVGRYLGFDIMMRSTCQRYRKTGGFWVPVDDQDAGFGASDQTGDSAASLFYHESAVERALGTVEMFDGKNRPEYYGDIYSFLLRMGGRIRRASGIYSVVEDAAA